MDVVRYCLLGNVDAAKSTLLGVLKTGELDDGKGKSRSSILQMKHEKQSGNTTNSNMVKIWNTEKSKYIQLIDLPGHSKYFSMTLRGMMEYNPSYAIIIVSAHKGITETVKNKGFIVPNMTKVHLQVCAYLKIPFIVIISKIDNCPEDRLELTIQEVKAYTKKMKIKFFYHVKDADTLRRAKEAYFNEHADMYAPYFKISNVTGEGLSHLKDFLFNIPLRHNLVKELETLKNFCITQKINKVFEIYKSYYVKGIGTIVFGCLKVGSISKNDELRVGPFTNKNISTFIDVRIRSLHDDERHEIDTLVEGKYGCLSIKPINNKDVLDKNKLHKGKVVTDKGILVTAIETQCKIGHHKTTITPKFKTYIHMGTIGTTAKIIKADKFPIRSGDDVNITFELNSPQFIYPGSRLIFRDDGIKGHGIIKNIILYKST